MQTKISTLQAERNRRPIFSGALLKVASRCNLNCDYCYVYQHADQSWRDQPRFISEATVVKFAQRLREYVLLHGLSEFSVTFHGGEPLLMGAERLVQVVDLISDVIGDSTRLDFSLQSNGTLLTDEVIDQLEEKGINISLSLDGPRLANDRHRLDHGGQSSYHKVIAAIQRLLNRNSPIFSGVLAVIDPTVPPRELLEFFAKLSIPRLDLLLPDATYTRPPAGRDGKPELYSAWLSQALEIWVTEFSDLPVRWFDALLASRLGVPSATDAMGFGSVSLLVIDTDGSYTDHDVFKITGPKAGALDCGVQNSTIDQVTSHDVIREHGFRLSLEGLSAECRHCPVVEACGGGSVMHRWHPQRHLDAPSIYCPELFYGLETATTLMRNSFQSQFPDTYTRHIVPWLSGQNFLTECQRWRDRTESQADAAALEHGFVREARSAASVLLHKDKKEHQFCNERPVRECAGLWMGQVAVQSNDADLSTPFLNSIRVLPCNSTGVQSGMEALAKLPEIFGAVSPELPDAMATLLSNIVFVEPIADELTIFSFSDDSAPNVLYVAPMVGNAPLATEDLGDSILHEFLHHILYHMERDAPMLFDHVYPRFPAPWRKGLRPAGGFLHGTYVFAGLAIYWRTLAKVRMPGINREKAIRNTARFTDQAVYGIQSLRQFALLTPRGQSLLEQLSECLGDAAKSPMIPPGLSLFA